MNETFNERYINKMAKHIFLMKVRYQTTMKLVLTEEYRGANERLMMQETVLRI